MLSLEENNFVISHASDNTSKLLFAKDKYDNLDIKHLVNVIEARKKIKDKLPEWYNTPALDFPSSISVEQCSSQATAYYKKQFVNQGDKVADLTGGLGVDSWALSTKAESLTYIEKNRELFDAVKNNFTLLGCDNIDCLNLDSVDFLKNTEHKQFDLIYIDPARRDKNAKKVYSITDCEPNLLELKDMIYRLSPKILAKVSPMADIARTLEQFPDCREIHIVAVNNECKEILLLLEKEFEGAAKIVATDIHNDRSDSFSFYAEEERSAEVKLLEGAESGFIYQPNRAILKAGAFRLVSQRFGLKKLAVSTHLYHSVTPVTEFPGRAFRINEIIPFNKNGINSIRKKFPSADCLAVNFPLDTVSLTKRLNLKAGGDIFLIATTLSSNEKVIFSLRRR